jgi:dolichol-phosphate mannosyltransferase
MNNTKVSIILPTYNERENIEKLVPLIFSYVPDARIIVVDDNSPDGTSEVIEILQKNYPKLILIKRDRKDGLGKAYIHAFREALKDVDVGTVVMMDADFSHHPKYLPEMLSRVKDGSVVIGSRYVKGGKTTGWELWRRTLSVGGNWYCRIITGMPIRDCTGGFNAISASALRRIDLNALDLSGYAFIMDLKYALYSSGAIFTEIPIVFANRTKGDSKISNHIIREGIIAPWKIRLKK